MKQLNGYSTAFLILLQHGSGLGPAFNILSSFRSTSTTPILSMGSSASGRTNTKYNDHAFSPLIEVLASHSYMTPCSNPCRHDPMTTSLYPFAIRLSTLCGFGNTFLSRFASMFATTFDCPSSLRRAT